jgi:hypothetical protein
MRQRPDLEWSVTPALLTSKHDMVCRSVKHSQVDLAGMPRVQQQQKNKAS